MKAIWSKWSLNKEVDITVLTRKGLFKDGLSLNKKNPYSSVLHDPIVELSYTEIVKNNIERVSHKIFLVLADNLKE